MKILLIVIIAIALIWLVSFMLRLQWQRSLPRRMELMAKETQKALDKHNSSQR